MPQVTDHICHQEEIIREFTKRLGTGDVTFNTLSHKLEELSKSSEAILSQTQKTNGRVTRLEKFSNTVVSVFVGIILCLLAMRFGLFTLLMEAIK